MIFEPALEAKAAALLAACRVHGLKLTAAESCTGGLVSGVLTAIPGASEVFEAGFVTYSNAAKTTAIGVDAAIIRRHGAVSEATARAMAEGALAAAGADLALAVTGIAGPAGGTAEKPVGLVHIAVARRGFATRHRKLLLGDQPREIIRLRSVGEVLDLGLAQAETPA